jgi:hypothetical protein
LREIETLGWVSSEKNKIKRGTNKQTNKQTNKHTTNQPNKQTNKQTNCYRVPRFTNCFIKSNVGPVLICNVVRHYLIYSNVEVPVALFSKTRGRFLKQNSVPKLSKPGLS